QPLRRDELDLGLRPGSLRRPGGDGRQDQRKAKQQQKVAAHPSAQSAPRGEGFRLLRVNVVIKPEPTAEERRAIEAALAAPQAGPAAYASRWRAAALAVLGDDALTEESWSDPGVV